MDKPWIRKFVTEYVKTSNASQSYLKAKPGITLESAQQGACIALKDAKIQALIQRETDKELDETRFSKEQILDNIDVIRSKTLKNKQFSVSLKANKELAELAGLYEKGVDDPGQYLTLIKSLTINTTISSGSPPKQVEHEVDAEFEDVDNAD